MTDMTTMTTAEYTSSALRVAYDAVKRKYNEAVEFLGKAQAFMVAQVKRAAPDDHEISAKKLRTGPVTSSNDLVNFWSACRNELVDTRELVVAENNDENSKFNFFVMPNNVALLGSEEEYGTSLLIRPSYPGLFNDWLAATGKLRKDGLIGTPGVGKSFFLLYALCRLGMERYEHPIVFQNIDGMRLFFHGDKVQEGDGSDFKEYLRDPRCIYLVDGAANSLPINVGRARTFLVSSPNKQVYGAFKKTTQHSPMIAPICTLYELLAIRAINPDISDVLNVNDVERAFNVTGGSARAMAYWAIDSNNTPESQVNVGLGMCNLAACRHAAEHAIASEETVKHSLFHINPLPAKPRQYELRPASPYVRRMLSDAFVRQSEHELVNFLASSESLPAFPTLRGILFEGYAIKKLIAGGEFRCCELMIDGSRGEEETVAVPAAREELFQHLGGVREISNNIHHRPLYGTLEAIDSFISGEWLFQVTTAKDHDVKINGLSTVLKRLRALNDQTAASDKARLFFVVPENIYSEHYQRRQTLIQRGTVAKVPGEMDKVKQYVLCLKY
jgi:hypothetical protein